MLALAVIFCGEPLRIRAGESGIRYAFLVGCSQYRKIDFKPLPYTDRDVLGFREALLATGFDDEHITVLYDGAKERRLLPEKAQILEALDAVLDGMRPEDTLVVALSGHGLQYKGDPVSYFAPVDGKLADKKSLIALSGAGGLYEKLRASRAKRKVLLVNACRNKPAVSLDFAAEKLDLVDEDRDEVPEGIAALYSCKAGQKSYYDPDRKMAIFFEHLINAWKGEYTRAGPVTLDAVLAQVRDKTKTHAMRMDANQVPVIYREFKGDWVITPTAIGRPVGDLEAGRKLLGEGQPAKALLLLERAVAAAPKIAAPRVARGLAYLRIARYALAVADFKEAARLDAQSGEAALQLGWVHFYGFGISPPENGEALRWFRKAADLGDGEAMVMVGDLTAQGLGTPMDPEDGVRWYRKAINQGEPLGMVYLAGAYRTGRGVSRNPGEAERWYVRALPQLQAAASRPLVMYHLGVLCANGYGRTQDDTEAVEWYRKAAEQGHPRAMASLGRMHANGWGAARDPVEALRWYRKGAELGSTAAMTELGRVYAKGLGVSRDEAVAVQWYRRAADLGDPSAMFNLGLAHASGQGVVKDDAAAFQWYQKAAARGMPAAMTNLGVMYSAGTGVPRDEALAVHWYRTAAELDNATAMNNLGWMYANGLGVTRDESIAVQWYRKGAEKGHASAMNHLASMYENGRGITRDLSEAIRWYRKAAEKGHAAARESLQRLNAGPDPPPSPPNQ